MIDLGFFKAWLNKKHPHTRFDIQPLAGSAIELENVDGKKGYYFGLISDYSTGLMLDGNEIHFGEQSSGGSFVLFNKLTAHVNTQFMGYVAYPLL